jgi:hypothetical protein
MAFGRSLPRRVPALPGEIVRRRWAAQHAIHRGRAVLGRLYLTSRRVVFVANELDIAGRDIQFGLFEIVSAGVLSRDPGALFSGGMRRRLGLARHTGVTEAFLVNRPAAVAAAINAETGRH